MNLFEFSMEQFKFGKTINIVECFAGIGTQAMAWKRLAKKHDLTLNFVAISEIDKFAIQSYKAIHGEIENLGGIGSFDRFPPGVDLCSWSFPCQDISLAGKQKGMDPGSRSNYGYVFLDTVANTPKEERPKVLLMENVPALVSEKFKEDYAEIHRRLEELGYTSWGGLLNAKDFGIPQNRERIFVVSILGEYSYTFPKAIPLELKLKDLLEEKVDEKYYLSKKMLDYFTEKTQTMRDAGNGFKFETNKSGVAKTITTRANDRLDDNFVEEPVTVKKVNENYYVLVGGKWDKMHDIGKRVYNTDYIAPTIHTMGGGNLEPKIIETFGNKRLNETLEKHKIEETTIVDAYNKTIHTDLAPTITTRTDPSNHVVADNGLVRVRKLTPRETWRLMNIDDEDFDKVENIMSNAQLYKQAGNAIVVGVLEKIFEQML